MVFALRGQEGVQPRTNPKSTEGSDGSHENRAANLARFFHLSICSNVLSEGT